MENPTPEFQEIDMSLAAATAKAEAEAYDLFKARYQKLHAPPTDPMSTVWSKMGWEFYGSIITAIGTLFLAAFATAGEFYHIADAIYDNPVFTWGRTISAMLGVEGLIVIMAVLMVLTRSENKMSYKNYETARNVALGVSILAGLNGVLRGVLPMDNIIVQGVSFLISGALAVGASYLAMVGGEIVGFQTRFVREQVKTENDNFRNAKLSWDNELNAAFANSYERRMARSGLSPIRTPVRSVRSVRNGERTERTNGQSAVKQKVFDYLRRRLGEEPALVVGKGELGATAVSEALGTGKGNTSEFIREFAEIWAAEHPVEQEAQPEAV